MQAKVARRKTAVGDHGRQARIRRRARAAGHAPGLARGGQSLSDLQEEFLEVTNDQAGGCGLATRMKNKVIDGVDNCGSNIFAASEKVFDLVEVEEA